MVWNEPNNDNNNKEDDIWSRHKKRQQNSPPNLDEVFGSFSQGLKRLLGGKAPSPTRGGASGDKFFITLLSGLAIIMAVVWALSGIYFVQQAEQAIVLRFGHYQKTVEPGAHWYPRFIDSIYKQNVQATQTLEYKSEMLTKDTNIIDVQLTVNYRIENLRNYFFKVDDARLSLQEATASAVRQVIGQTNMDAALSADRGQVGANIQQVLLNLIKKYQTGLVVTGVNFQLAKPPEEVADAFDDAIKANQDKKRYVKEATAYSANITPIAQGDAERIKRLATADKQQMIARAQAEVAPFLSWLTQYQQYPQIVRERFYLTGLEQVLSQTHNIVIDNKGNNLMMLPLNKLLSNIAPSKQLQQTSLPKLDTTDQTGASSEAVAGEVR